jgi:hypothetical protein
MKKYIIFFTACIICFIHNVYAQTAVIPYKINNSSIDFPESMGGEYSRLLSIAAFIVKDNIEIASPRDIDMDLGRLKINPQEVITGDDLDLLGRTRHIDYFLSGSLSRNGKGYRSESVLYSVRDGKIAVRIRVEDGDLYKLAEKEVREAFVQYRNKTIPADGGITRMDAVFLLDMSYGIQHDWPSVRNAIIEFSSNCIDTLRIDTRIYLVPFSDRHGHTTGSVSINSIPDVRRELENLNPSGASSSDTFNRSLQHAVQNIRWRYNARKVIVLISNSRVNVRTAEKYGVLARNKGIPIVSISLGQIIGDQGEVFDRLSRITGGQHVHAAYHQKIFNAKGESLELYLENGRLFKSQFPENRWKKGLFLKRQKSQGHEKQKSFAEEIYYNDRKISVFPHTISEAYGKITMDRIINRETVENNIDALLINAVKTGGKKKAAGSMIGKALVSDGKISFWVYTEDAHCLAYLEKSRKSDMYIPLGVIVQKDTSAAYGVTLVPHVTDLDSGYIPALIKAGLSDIVKQSEYYMTRGLLYPPVWFVNVKVDTVERLHGGKDIRQR